MSDLIDSFDRLAIGTFRNLAMPMARLALFVVYFWFGFLKLLGESPANPLVAELLHRTLSFITFDQFILFLGVYEVLIGICFVVPGLERLAVILIVPHMVVTFLPLIVLPSVTWQDFLVPTLEGQYIIKNLLIIALSLSIAAHLKPWSRRSS